MTTPQRCMFWPRSATRYSSYGLCRHRKNCKYRYWYSGPTQSSQIHVEEQRGPPKTAVQKESCAEEDRDLKSEDLHMEMEQNTCQNIHSCADLIMQISWDGSRQLTMKVLIYLYKPTSLTSTIRKTSQHCGNVRKLKMKSWSQDFRILTRPLWISVKLWALAGRKITLYAWKTQ